MKNLIICITLIFPNLSFGDAKKKAVQCAACHGAEGISPGPNWPNLAGQKKEYLIKQLKAFKSGERKDPLMTGQAALLSDADVEELAKYFSELKAK